MSQRKGYDQVAALQASAAEESADTVWTVQAEDLTPSQQVALQIVAKLCASCLPAFCISKVHSCTLSLACNLSKCMWDVVDIAKQLSMVAGFVVAEHCTYTCRT